MFLFKSSQPAAPTSRLLCLPPELRLAIYAYLFTTSTGVWNLQHPSNLPQDYFAILLVCKNIYNEARFLPMELNTFTIELLSFDHVLSRFTRLQHQALRSLRLEATLPARQFRWAARPLYPFDAGRLSFDMRRLKGLRKVHVRIVCMQVVLRPPFLNDRERDKMEMKEDVEAAAAFMKRWVLRGREEERLEVVIETRKVKQSV